MTEQLIQYPLSYRVVYKNSLQLPCSYSVVSFQENKERETTIRNKRMFLEVLQKTRGVVSVVCEHLNIGRSTYYHWKKTDSDFSVKVEEIIFSKPEMIEDRLYAKAMDGDVSSMKFFLKHKHPDYGGKSNTESTVHIYHHVDRPPEKSDETNDFTLMLWKEARKRWEIKNSIKTENTDENPDSDATEKTGKSV